MASTLKGQKEKPHGGAPRWMPRPTAASAARAARIATNRNLAVSAINSKQSVSRTSTSPSKLTALQPPAKGAKSPPQTAEKTQESQKDTNHEVQIEESPNNDPMVVCLEHDTVSNCVSNMSLKEDESYSVEKNEINLELIAEDSSNQECKEKPFEMTRDEDSQSQKSRASVNPESSIKTESASPNISRPVTPIAKSRPLTPKRSSRPQTPQSPQITSRPVTPCHPNQRLSSSRPVTPQRTCAVRRSNAPPASRACTPNAVVDQTPPTPKVEDDDLQAVFAARKKQFHAMKKELDLKQRTMFELYEELKSLHQRLASETSAVDNLQLQELVVFNVADWTTEEVSELCRDAAATYCVDGAAEFITTIVPFDDSAVTNLDQQVIELPSRFADLCIKAFTARQEVIDWVKDLVQNSHAEVGSGEAVNRIAVYNVQGLEFCESLRELKHFSDIAVDSLAKLSRRAIQERRALIAVGEKLVHEVARLQEEVKQIKGNNTQHVDEPLSTDMEALRLLLEEERTAKTQAKDKLASTELQLRQARQRITKMDRQLREAEASIASLTGTVKSLEDQSRQKEVQLEAKARKLRESLKTGEMTNNQIIQQRNALQIELQDLKEQVENMTKEHKAAVQDLNKTIKELNLSLEEQRALIQKESDMKAATEEALGNCQLLAEELKAKVHHFEIIKPNPDLPSEKEMAIWSELQAVKEVLRATEEEVNACKREKIRFLETLAKIGDTDSNKVGMQQKLAAELATKEEIIGKMQFQLREYTKSLKLNEQKVAQYEQFTRDLIAHQKVIEEKQSLQTDYPDLQQEIMNLRMELLNAAHRNEDLVEQLAQKEQQLEQQDKTSRAQARVIKVREELINMLKNKETEQSRELACLQQDLEQRMKIVDEVNHQIAAKADEIQELFTTLESKQQQIHRLERIVLALEEQQRRAQAQRTRHEEKIAALEHELYAGAQKERKFLFF